MDMQHFFCGTADRATKITARYEYNFHLHSFPSVGVRKEQICRLGYGIRAVESRCWLLPLVYRTKKPTSKVGFFVGILLTSSICHLTSGAANAKISP